MANNPLSMVGMALKAGRVVVGEEPCGIACREKKTRLLLLASDAADNTRRRCEYFAQEGNCILLTVPDTKAGLGGIVGRKSCAMVAVTDIGLAAAIAKGLAVQDPSFQEAADKMALKAKRAQERKTKEHRPKAEKPVEQNPFKRDDDRKPYGKREGDGQRTYGDRKPFVKRDGDRKPYVKKDDEGQRTYGDRKPFKRDGDRKPFEKRDGDEKPFVKHDGNGEQRSYSANKSFRGARPVKKGKGSFRKKDNA